MQNITVRLVDEELWKEFYPITEMIVTRKGRALFPKLDFRAFGLVPDLYYAFQIHFERVDDSRYKFEKGVWGESATEEIITPEKILRHNKGFRSGEDWMSGNIRFDRLKITNNINTIEPTHFVVQTMCKYVPVLTIVEMGPVVFNMPPEQTGDRKQFRFDLAEFIPVTAYQNPEITQLKVQHNKYAKSFRTGVSRKRAASPAVEKKPIIKISASSTPMIFENPAKRVAWPPTPFYPSPFMQYNTDMANFYYPPEIFPAYHHTYPNHPAAYDGEHMAYNATMYWPMMPSSTTEVAQQSPDSSGYSATCQSTLPYEHEVSVNSRNPLIRNENVEYNPKNF